jgi:hypothetical protein
MEFKMLSNEGANVEEIVAVPFSESVIDFYANLVSSV